MLGIILLSLVHVMVENYLIEEVSRIGGDSSSVGIALFVATGIEAPVMLYYAKECTTNADMVKGQSVALSSFSLGGALGCLIGGYIISGRGVISMLQFGLVIAVLGTAILFVTVPKAEYCSERKKTVQ